MRKGYLIVLLLAVLWSFPPIIITVLGGYFDAFSQNFYRFFSAAVFLIIISYLHKKDEFIATLRNLRQFILPFSLISLFQTLFVIGIYLTSPAITAFVSKLDVVFVVIFAYFMFKDERMIIMHKEFLVPALLAFVGVIGVVLGKGGEIGITSGALIIVFAAMLWGLYINTVKKAVSHINPLIAVTFIYSLSTIVLLGIALVFGKMESILSAPVEINLLLIISGILFVGIANAMNYFVIKDIGASLTANFLLITPFLTALFSNIILGEEITIVQLFFGLILLTGLGLLAKYRKLFEEHIVTHSSK